jgi:HSP20 family protein
MNILPWRKKGQTRDVKVAAEQTPLALIRSELDRLFDRFLGRPDGWFDFPSPADGSWAPALDVSETEDTIAVQVEIPGVEAKDLDVSVSGHMLTISGRKEESQQQSGRDFQYAERRFGSFRRRIELPAEVDPDQVSAEHKNGVLTVHLKKLQPRQAKRVSVRPN